MIQNDYLFVAALVFVIGMLGIVVNRRNVIALLMCIELMLLAVNTKFIVFSHVLQQTAGEIFVFFVLAVAAAEAAIGLAIFILMYRHKQSVDVEALNELKG